MEDNLRDTPLAVIRPNATREEKIAHLRAVANTMDSAFEIPGLGYRFGLDGIIGLIPGIGDIFGLLVSAYFILIAAQLQVPAPVLARMFINVMIDSAVGSIPVVGDLFDFAWKGNRRNLHLLERSLTDPRSTRKNSILFLVAIGLALFAVLALVMVTVAWLITLLIGAFNTL